MLWKSPFWNLKFFYLNWRILRWNFQLWWSINLSWGLGSINLSWGLRSINLSWGLGSIGYHTILDLIGLTIFTFVGYRRRTDRQATLLTDRKQDSQDEMIMNPLESVVEGYIFPNNISRLQQQTHNRMNPRLKKSITKNSLYFLKKLHIW